MSGKYKSFQGFTDALKAAISKTTQTAQMQAIAEYANTQVINRVRLGYGAQDSGKPRYKLPALSDKYKRARKAAQSGGVDFDAEVNGVKKRVQFRAKTVEPLSSKTSVSKSNLTYTSQMLDSSKPIAVSEGSATLGFTGTRKDGLTNSQVAGFVSEKRPFYYLTDLEKVRLIDFIREKLDKAVAGFKK